MSLRLHLFRTICSRNNILNPFFLRSSSVSFPTMDELEQKFRDISVDENNKNNEKIVVVDKIVEDKSFEDKQNTEKTNKSDQTNVASSSKDKKKTLKDKDIEREKATFESIADGIQDGTYKNIIFMVGAGISTCKF